jgi:hypothetical protein
MIGKAHSFGGNCKDFSPPGLIWVGAITSAWVHTRGGKACEESKTLGRSSELSWGYTSHRKHHPLPSMHLALFILLSSAGDVQWCKENIVKCLLLLEVLLSTSNNDKSCKSYRKGLSQKSFIQLHGERWTPVAESCSKVKYLQEGDGCCCESYSTNVCFIAHLNLVSVEGGLWCPQRERNSADG